MPFVIDHTTPEQRATAASLALSLTSVSATIGSLLAGWAPSWIGQWFGLPVPSVLTYRLSLLLGIAVCSLSLIPLLSMRTARTTSQNSSRVTTSEGSSAASLWQIRRWVVGFALAGGILSIGNGAIVPFYNVFLSSLGLSTKEIGIIFALANLSAAVLGLLAPPVSRWLGPVRAFLIIRTLPILLFLPLMVIPTIPLAILAHFARLISISLAWPIDSVLISELLPSAARAQAFSLRSAAWNLGFGLASFLAGRIIVAHGYAPAFLAYAIFCLIAVIFFGHQFAKAERSARLPPPVQPAVTDYRSSNSS